MSKARSSSKPPGGKKGAARVWVCLRPHPFENQGGMGSGTTPSRIRPISEVLKPDSASRFHLDLLVISRRHGKWAYLSVSQNFPAASRLEWLGFHFVSCLVSRDLRHSCAYPPHGIVPLPRNVGYTSPPVVVLGIYVSLGQCICMQRGEWYLQATRSR